ncbi:hypothetical protein CEXT_188001 [Caerostris extrusa]|uniref:Uncharacterized protein n=1 Tax=Caerostris extrusa TaxID=172846 RepID=A0AAV4MND2_CAEEX|nr:hypothetical protein CEXT_188001 [Caerostris extrusa]
MAPPGLKPETCGTECQSARHSTIQTHNTSSVDILDIGLWTLFRNAKKKACSILNDATSSKGGPMNVEGGKGTSPRTSRSMEDGSINLDTLSARWQITTTHITSSSSAV